jgi:putative PIN family toxin of toxin-antitoxin system
MRLVLDTDVLVSAVRSHEGASRLLWRAARVGVIEVAVSTAMLVEYQSVLLRPDMLSAVGWSARDAESFLDAFVALAKPATPQFLWRPMLRDPNDEMVLEAAVSASADAIVTFNVRDFRLESSFRSLAILTPGEAVRRIAWRS